VCTGALVLDAAGLLQGKRATTHCASHDLLPAYGAIPVRERVVRDGSVMTGGGMTAGIDLGLALVAELIDREVAEAIQLNLEAPAPPFPAGDPETAPAAVVAAVRKRIAPIVEGRARLTEAAKRGRRRRRETERIVNPPR
jgi:cyclohexyl-isocyanide hydratase